MSDSIRKLAEQIRAGELPVRKRGERPSKSNRTHPFSEPQYTEFQKYCRAKGYYVSDVLDLLIRSFLDEVAGDVPAVDDAS